MSAGGAERHIKIEPLGPDHVREQFDCGNPAINAHFLSEALSAHETYHARAFVAVEPGSLVAIGFYCLTMRHLKGGRAPGYIPAIYLPMIGVCTTHQRQGIGERLIVDAFDRSVRVSEDAGAQFLWLNSIDEQKLSYYESLGFARVKRGRLEMWISLQTLRAAAEGAD